MNKDNKLIAKITLKILNKKSWQLLTIDEVNKKSKLKSFNKLIKDKKDLLNNVNVYFDYSLSLLAKNIEDSNNKDMIFEILMMRFDILQKNRKAIISIFTLFKNKPNELISFLPQLLDSTVLMIKYSKISNRGIIGQLKVKGILIIYILTFFIWVKDDSPTLEKTMISLDGYLDQAGKILKLIK